MERAVPILKKKMTLRLGRNTSLFIDLEMGVTGLKGVARGLGSRLGTVPALTRAAARLPRGAVGVPSARRKPARRERGSNTPVFFVMGVGKSGTSWLMRTLDGHPEILCKGEGRFFAADWRRANFDPEGTQAMASSLYYALLHSEYLRMWVERSVWAREGDAARHLDNLTRLATEHFLVGRLGENFIQEVSRIYPEAKVIHIIRDGRDQAVSMLHHVWNRSTDQGGVQTLKAGEFERREAYRRDPKRFLQTGEGMFTEERLRGAARSWNARVGKTAKDGPVLLGPNYTEVRYEDLLERPNEEVGRLAGFLGADTSEKALQQAVGSASFEKLSKGRQRGQEDTSSFYRKGVAGDWNNYFTERDKEIYKEEAGELLIRLGYERDLDW